MFQAQISEDGEDGRWFMVFSCCCLRIVYCLFCVSARVFVSPPAMCFWLSGELLSLCPQGRQRGRSATQARDHNSQRTRTYADVTRPALHALPARSVYGHPVLQYLLHMMMRWLHISRLSIPPRSLAQHPRLHLMHLNKCYCGNLNGFYRPGDHKSCSAW